MLKSRYGGELGLGDVGSTVELAGWVQRRRDHGGLIFVDLRDSTGLIQVVFNAAWSEESHAISSQMRSEYVVWVQGSVELRAPGTANPKMGTGDVEVHAMEARILNAARTPPFYISDEGDIEELLRLRYRYLDLRRPSMHQNLVVRHRVISYIRNFLGARGFIEVETPILLASTPEGARDYLVPSRVNAGKFYALPQSPQQLKQLLMVAGMERYFQIARCFRDEDLRADRQPEFTQLDLEMSFVEQDDILELVEQLYRGLTAEIRPERGMISPFPRLTYAESIRRFGTDKPDIRFGMELFSLDDIVAGSQFAVFRAALELGGHVKGICLPGGLALSRKQIDDLTETAKGRGARGLVTIAVQQGAEIDNLTAEMVRSPAARFLTPEELQGIVRRAGAQPGDLVLVVADQAAVVNPVLDLLRRDLAQRFDLVDPNLFAFCFVIDFPLFEWNEAEGRWDSAHHPFTAPRDEDLPLLDTAPGEVRSKAYDLVCNGWELGSGSIRIHERAMQARIFALLGITPEEQQTRFGHMLEAFEYGAPPHGGVAPGIDRTVALLLGKSDIREVIAFPKTKSATDPMTGAPSVVAPQQLQELHIALLPD
ncbi:MAG: aspartate--tRNA ligase [Dehalococcoidia bacterium]